MVTAVAVSCPGVAQTEISKCGWSINPVFSIKEACGGSQVSRPILAPAGRAPRYLAQFAEVP